MLNFLGINPFGASDERRIAKAVLESSKDFSEGERATSHGVAKVKAIFIKDGDGKVMEEFYPSSYFNIKRVSERLADALEIDQNRIKIIKSQDGVGNVNANAPDEAETQASDSEV